MYVYWLPTKEYNHHVLPACVNKNEKRNTLQSLEDQDEPSTQKTETTKKSRKQERKGKLCMIDSRDSVGCYQETEGRCFQENSLK